MTAYLQDVAQRHRLLSAAEERECFRLARAGDREAHERLVYSLLPMVVAHARKFRGFDPQLLELVQEGNLGLLHAIGEFDLERGCRLSTYALPWINNYMRKHVRRLSLVRIPSDIFDAGVEKRRSPRLRAALRQALAGLDRLDSHCDFRACERTSTPAEQAELNEDAARLRVAFARLDERRQFILRKRLAGATLFEVSRPLGLNRERVRQLEQSSLRKLAHWLRADLSQVDSLNPRRRPRRSKRRRKELACASA